MENSYLVRLNENKLFCFYYAKSRGILYKTYENSKWLGEKALLEQGKEHFTVTVDDKGVIYILCQDMVGDVVLLTTDEGEWTSKVILKNQSPKVHSILLKPIITDNGLCLIYNVPVAEEKANYIVYQIFDGNGKWSPAQRIDRFNSMAQGLFQVQHVSREHILLFYQTRTSENCLGYREITPTELGNYNTIFSTMHQIQDSSFLTTDSSIHAVCIIKSMFSHQLLYRKKEGEEFSNPIVISESQKLENCMLFYVKNVLYIMFISNGQLFETKSNDNGKTFYRPIRYKNKFCLNPMKSFYVTSIGQSEDTFYCRELYVDRIHPWDIQVLPDKYDDFYPELIPIIRPDVEAINKQSKSAKHAEAQQAVPDDVSEKIFSLTNQVTHLQRQINEKNEQLLDMSSLLKERNEEINQIEAERKNYYIKSLDEREELLEKIHMLEKENNDLKAKLKIEEIAEITEATEIIENTETAEQENVDFE